MNNSAVWEKFLDVAELYRDKIAIEFEGEVITYHQLRKDVDDFSAILIQHTGSTKARIAFLIENRIKAITAILSILKIGHAFIPLDPEDPEERLNLILEDCEPILLLVSHQEIEKSEKITTKNCKIINVDEAELAIDTLHNTSLINFQDHLAYILYTSGTTGKPKGVCQTQKNLIYFVDSYSRKLNIQNQDRVSLVYTLSFSAANMDIFGALFNGATLCAYNTRKEGVGKFAAWFSEQKISVLHSVPTVLKKSLSGIPPTTIFDSVRIIDLGGETLTYQDILLLRKYFNLTCILINHLAATEISVIAQFEVPSMWDLKDKLVPVGIPPLEVQIKIIDEHGNAVPLSTQGKIQISSPYISPGYWKQEELNHKYFSTDPDKKGWRTYHTDDIGFINNSGDLVFIGRQGSRIKIRGQSVDLNEVEETIKKLSIVKEVIVMPYHQNVGVEADSLIAHIVLKDSIDRDFLKIRKELLEFLPQYMVPNFFMAHTSLPQTSSGKIDRQYLSRLRVEDHSNQKELPINYLEVHVSFLFQRIIKLKRMPSRKDDFFLLGGDSMGAVELQLELNNVINKEVPISDIISDSTVAGLASLLENLSSTTQEKKSPVLVQLSDKGSLSPLFLVHGRAGQAPISPHFIRLMGDDQPIYSFQAKGLNGIDAPAKSIKEMAEDYIREMKVVQPKGPYYLGAMCVGSYIAILMAQMLIKLGETIYPLLLIDPPAPPFAPPPESFQQKEFLDKFSISARDHVMQSAKEGKYNVDLKNNFRRSTAIQIAIHMVSLLSRFKTEPYSGEVCMIVSEERMGPNGWSDKIKYNKVFLGDVKIYKVTDKHDEILNSQNPEFNKHLKNSLEYIRQAGLQINET